MLSKRVLWLTCAAIVGWLIWMRLRQRQDEFATTTPQFAPPHTFRPATPAIAPARQPEPDHPAAAPAPAPPIADAVPASTADTASPAASPEAPEVSEADDIQDDEISGYCMRCKTKRQIQNAHRETTESGRPAARGTCPVCGANMFTFLATNDDS